MHNDELRRRSHKGSRLLEMVSAKLDKLKASVAARRIKDPATIGRRIESALSSAKMSKHIKVDVAVGSFDYSIDPESVAKEAALDGIYVIRTTVDKKQLDSAGVVQAYKNLANIERAYRSLKTIDVNVRPVRHYLEGRVRSHVLLFTLSAHLMHHARSRLAPLTFRDTEVPAHESPVAKKHVSATAKIAYKVNQDGTPITSLRALFEELDTRTRNTCLIPGTDVTFTKTSIPTDIQRHAFELIGAKIPSQPVPTPTERYI